MSSQLLLLLSHLPIHHVLEEQMEHLHYQQQGDQILDTHIQYVATGNEKMRYHILIIYIQINNGLFSAISGITNLGEGTYQVIAMDSNSCTSEAVTQDLIAPTGNLDISFCCDYLIFFLSFS